MTTSQQLIGWPLLPVPDGDGRLQYPTTLEQSVRASLKILLATRPGEMIAHPDYGVGLDLYRGQLDDLALRREIRDTILEQVARWEPRVNLLMVDVEPSESEPGQLRVEIDYRVVRTGTSARLGVSLNAGA
ncbi:MAG: GPW/gp25 family protein [Myxococcota bacterium]